MRITNGMIMDSFLINMQGNMEKMNRYTNQLASNRKIVRLSDDPVGVLKALTTRQRLTRFEQYETNLVTAQKWADQADTSLQEISAHMIQLREEVINAAGVKNEGDRENISKLASALKTTIIEALNTTVGNQYCFAGYNTTNKPLQTQEIEVDPGPPPVTETRYFYNGLDMTDMSPANLEKLTAEMSQHISLEVGFSLQMDVSLNALEVLGLGDNNLLATLDEIIGLMENKDGLEDSDVVIALSNTLGAIDKAHNNIASCLVKVGSVESRITMLQDRYSQDVINYNDIRSKIEDIDSAEVIMDWKMAEAVYKQTLSTGARIIMPTLMDFLS